jgi:F0F1-type ATP synthase delta subunit
MKKNYIKATTQLLRDGSEVESVLANLKSVLTQKGYEGMYTEVLHGVLTELAHATNTNTAKVYVANKADATKLQSAIEASLAKLGANIATAETIVDETLVGGYVAVHNGKSINASYKEQLVTLYRKIIA